MNREHLPCAMCGRFTAAAHLRKNEDGPGHCEGFDKTVLSTDRPCVLFNLRDAWQTRRGQQPPRTTIPRKSAPTAAPTTRETTCKT